MLIYDTSIGQILAEKENPMKLTLNDLIGVASPIKPDRRQFIGGSDARIIMSPDEAALIRLWRKSAARRSRRTCRAISSSNWA
jgi:hypothetical protein